MRNVSLSIWGISLFLLLLMCPITIYSQQANQYWTTPVADVAFTESKIIFTFSTEAHESNFNLEPLFYDTRLIEMRTKTDKSGFSSSNIKELKTSLNENLSKWNMDHANNHDKHEFLETCTVVTILNCTQNEILPENAVKILGYLQEDPSMEIASNAKLVFELYQSYK